MKIKLMFLALLFIQSGFTQVNTSKEFSYTMSDPYQVIDGSKWYFNVTEDEVVSLKLTRSGFVMQKFGGSKLNESKRTELPNLPDGSAMESVIQLQDKIYIFYSLWDKSATTEQLFARELDVESGKFKSDKSLIKVKGKISGVLYSGMFFNYSVRDKFSISTDFDESKILVQYRLVPEDKRDAYNKDKIGFYTFTKDLEEIWGGVTTMPYTEKKMNNVGYCLDNDANVYLLAEIYKDETTKRTTKTGDPNYDLELIRIDKDDQSMNNTKIELKDKFLSNYGFFEGNGGEIVIAGYYSNDKYFKANGIYAYVLNSEGSILSSSSNEFDSEVVKQFESSRTQARIDKDEQKGSLGINNLKLRNLIMHEDGSITTVGEVYYVVTHYNSKTGQTTYTYYYEEMIVCNVNVEGEMKWMTKLPKFQYGSAPRGGMSFHLISGSENMYLLFLDNVKNLEITKDQVPARHNDGRGGYLTAYQVSNQTGESTKLSIFDTKSVNGIPLYQFNTERIVKINDDEFAVEFYKKAKEDVMIRVRLEGK